MLKTCGISSLALYGGSGDGYGSLPTDFGAIVATLESVEARLVLYKQNESILQENLSMLKNEVRARDAVLVTLKQKQNQTEQERDDLKLKLDKFQTSSKSLNELLASQTNNKHGLGYHSESDSESLSPSSLFDRSQHSGEYHVVPPPITGNFMPPKPDLVFHTSLIAVETAHSAFTVQLSPAKPAQDISYATRPMVPIIEDWVSNSEDEGVDHLIKDCNFHVKPKTQPTPRNSAHRGYNKQYASSTKKYPQKHIVPAAVLPKSKPVSITAARPGNAQYALKDKGVIDSNPKGGKISGKGKIKTDFKLPDESQVLLKVPRENNMYNVNLKDIVPSGDLTCLFAKTTIDESNLWRPKEANNSAGTQANDDQGANSEEIDLNEEHFVLPIWSTYSTTVKSSREKIDKNTGFKTYEKSISQVEQVFMEELEKLKRREKEANDAAESLKKEATHDIQNASTSSTNLINTTSTPLSTASLSRAFNDGELSYPDESSMPHLKDIYASPSEWIFIDSSYDDDVVVTDFDNLETPVSVSLTPTTRIHTIHPKTQILGDPKSAIQTRSKVNKTSEAHALVSYIQKQQRNNQKDFQHCLFACFLSQINPKKISQALEDERIEAKRIFLAFASYMGFIVYQMDVKSAFMYGTIDEEVYVSQPPGFVDPKFPNKVFEVVKALYGLHQAPRAWYATLCTFFEKSGYRRGAIDKTLFIKQDKKDIMLVKQKEDGIFISQDKYIAKILKKFDFLSVKTASTPLETQKPLFKNEEVVDVDVHIYRFQVTPKTSHLQAMKRIFRYLKGQQKLGLWYPKVSSFDLKAYSDSDYAGANLDRKSITGGCQFLGRRLISWQCKKQTIVATSTTESEYVAVAHCKVNTINDEVRIQALIDEKRVNIKESSICHTLKLDDIEVTSSLANTEIFDGLANALVPKQPLGMNLAALWHHQSFVLLQTKSSTSQGLCNCFDHQLGDMSHHKDIYDNPSLTKNVFANMKRVGSGFSRVVTTLFDNMLVPIAKEVGPIQDDVQSVSIPTKPSTLKPYKKHKSKKQQTQAPTVLSPEHKLPSPSNDPLPGGEDSLKLKEMIDLCTHLSNKVLELESEVIDIKSTYTERIKKLEGRVDRLEEENRNLKDLYSVYLKVYTVAPVVEKEKSFKQERIIADIDKDVEINLEEAQAKLYRIDLEHPKSVPRRRMGVVIQDPEETASTVVVHSEIEKDEAFARQLEAELNTNINWNVVMKQVKRSERLNDAVMKYQALKIKPLIEAQARKNIIIYLKNMAGYKINYFKGMTYSEIRPFFDKHYNCNQAFLEEVNEEVTVPEKEVEVEGHKREGESLEKEVTKKQKMDKEAKELKMKIYSLWKLVKESVSKDQKGRYALVKVKSWKLFELAGVRCITFSATQMFLLVEKRYPLTHLTLEQIMNNVRLEVKEVSEMSLELLRLVRRQLIEGYVPK
nr:hypothetical protein [Tanacetum cinerariifolium]